MSTEPTPIVSKEEERVIISCLNRAQTLLRLIRDAMEAQIEIQQPAVLFETVDNELNRVCGLVTGDIFVSKHGDVIINVGDRTTECPAPEVRP